MVQSQAKNKQIWLIGSVGSAPLLFWLSQSAQTTIYPETTSFFEVPTEFPNFDQGSERMIISSRTAMCPGYSYWGINLCRTGNVTFLYAWWPHWDHTIANWPIWLPCAPISVGLITPALVESEFIDLRWAYIYSAPFQSHISRSWITPPNLILLGRVLLPKQSWKGGLAWISYWSTRWHAIRNQAQKTTAIFSARATSFGSAFTKECLQCKYTEELSEPRWSLLYAFK